jgi:hypothetical protein
MNWTAGSARLKAGAAALMLVLAGAAMGVLVDRTWVRPREAVALPLTVQGMVEHLGLTGADEARVRALLDSMHADVLTAAEQGPEALAEAARAAHGRLEAALPEDARPGFRSWMEAHHRQMMERMQGGGIGPMHDPGAHRAAPGTGGR